MPMNRVRVAWTGFAGAPGVSTFYTSTTVTDMAPIRTFFTSINTLFPNSFQFQVANSGDIVQEATGQIVGGWAGPAQAVVPGQASGASYAAPVGTMVRWGTSAVIAGRRPIGKTFLVPMDRVVFDTNGTLTSTAITTIQNAANALLTSLVDGLRLWARPTDTRAGGSLAILTALVPDKAVVLRSRRD